MMPICEVMLQIVTRMHLCFIHCIQHVVAEEEELCKGTLKYFFCFLTAFMLDLFKLQYKPKMFSIHCYLNVFQLCF